jgi:hypothetical protein
MEAGWYDDPDDARLIRYWDGERWTEHRRPAAETVLTGPPPPPRPGPLRRLRDWWDARRDH